MEALPLCTHHLDDVYSSSKVKLPFHVLVSYYVDCSKCDKRSPIMDGYIMLINGDMGLPINTSKEKLEKD